MSEIVFDEDRTLNQPLEPVFKVPQRGFEGWFFKKIPGGYLFKKTLLYGLIILLFAVALFFIALGRFNLQTSKLNFEERTLNSQQQ